MPETFDLVGHIMEYESGTLGAEDTLKLFSHLIETGQAWSLQGSYGRAAKGIMDAGLIDEKGVIDWDKWNEVKTPETPEPPQIDYAKARESWGSWLRWYIEEHSAEQVFDSIMYNLQGAKSVCQYCKEEIECDIVEGGGVPDWKSGGYDYGCHMSPETNDEGCGGHVPIGVVPLSDEGAEPSPHRRQL